MKGFGVCVGFFFLRGLGPFKVVNLNEHEAL